ncbi:hypothetical protein O0L34_g14305 [Tuta absoluta]|nr:hypothetical protein O0L34_g14305 [Tuta absoluta]
MKRLSELDIKSQFFALTRDGGVKKTTVASNVNATRDSQLHAVLAARRRQLLSGRLATHINTLAHLAHKPNKGNTTFAQLEIHGPNNTTVKRITFENGSNEASPSLRLVTNDGSREIQQPLKPHEIRHLFVPKIFQDSKSRAGFINNRRKEGNKTRPNTDTTEIIFIPPEKLEGLEKEDLDPEEDFQVDESNHGLYLLNYSDTDNVTKIPDINKTSTISNDVKQVTTVKVESTTMGNNSKDIVNSTTTTSSLVENNRRQKPEINTTANSTDTKNTKLIKVENEKDKENHTLFMSDEIYNHFRPLETELPVEDMAPFLFFGQKIGGQVIGDNLTNSPSLSASTKSVNYIVAPPDKRKFNSRYSVTEKYRNTSAEEEEVNEDMDVSVVKNVIEKNKIRNTVKGPAPARHVGLVNAYRKYTSTTQSPSKSPNIGQLNVTEPIVQNVTPSTLDKNKNRPLSLNLTADALNNTNIVNGTDNSTNANSNRANATTIPRNYTRSYFNLRRRPLRLTAASSTDNNPHTTVVNTTTEKASTSVYTAVVTSVSITSSMKGPNKTEGINVDNTTVVENIEPKNYTTTMKAILLNETTPATTTPVPPASSPSTARSYKHRIRIRTTTTESTLNQPNAASFRASEASETTKGAASDLKQEATTSKISERLANLYKQDYEYDNTTLSGPLRRGIRRRRPTTTSTTTPSSTTSTTTTTTAAPIIITTTSSETPTIVTSVPAPVTLPSSRTSASAKPTTSPTTDVTDNFKAFIVTSRTSSESSSKPVLIPVSTSAKNDNKTEYNVTNVEGSKEPSQNEEVVIEADKSYTASYVLAGLGFLPVMAIVAFVLRNIMTKKAKEIDTEYEGYFDDSDIKKESPITPVARPPLPTPTKSDPKWEFPRNKLRLQTLLGQGNFGQVWKAEADDLNGHDGLTRLVAVKSIKETASQKEKQELLHEIYIMQKIGTHPNVVTLLACCTEQEPYLLIMEYVMCGKLLTYLRERRARPDRFSGSGALTSRDLTVFAYCVARGMDYIASKGIVHRDLAARNVLVDHNKLCKIADFGMSRCAGNGARTSRGALPVRWMAPEALLYNVYNHQTDVWAYGILLWEIVTLGSTPYAAMSGREVLTAVTEGYRLERPPHCKPQLYRAMHSCWHADPSQRPTFAALKSQLAELLDNEPSEGNYVDLDSFYQESSVYSDPSAIIHDDEGLSAEYDRERRTFRELNTGPPKFENRAFSLRDEEYRNKFSIGTPRMGGFGIRDVPFNERNFSDGEFNGSFNDKNFTERNFNDKNFTDRNFPDKNFSDPNFTERKDGKLSTSSFHRERERGDRGERENPLVSRNSFNGFPRVGTRDIHFQMSPDGRNKRVPEFECDI